MKFFPMEKLSLEEIYENKEERGKFVEGFEIYWALYVNGKLFKCK